MPNNGMVSRICVERILSGSALQGTLIVKVFCLILYTQSVFCHYVGYRHQLRRRHYRYETVHTLSHTQHTSILTLYCLFYLC